MAFLVPDNLKSRKDIPAGVQRVAKALEIALDSEATLWFEPPFDPSNQKPHYVLLIPDRGILVLEVLDTKAAGILGSLRGKLRLTRDGKEVEVESPLSRADRFADVLRERISAEPRISDFRIPVEAGAVLPSLTTQEASGAGLDKVLALDRCLFKEDLDRAIANSGEAEILRWVIRCLRGSDLTRLAPDLEKVLRGLIQPDTVIGRVAAVGTKSTQISIFRTPEGEEDVVRVMDRQQEAMAKSLGEGHRIIRGVAGSGKTLVLVYRVRLMARVFPQQRYLFACYNRSLAAELRALMAEHPNVDVYNLDGLMAQVIRAAGLRFPGYGNDSSGESVAQVALEALGRYRGERYKAVFLDEAQDFGTSALKFALGLLQPGADDFIIVADSAQNIYRRKFSWKSAGIQAQGRTRILRINYRNTREILQFASAFLTAGGDVDVDESPDPENEHAVIPPEAARRTGKKPVLEVCSGTVQSAAAVLRQVQGRLSSDSPARSIGILYGTTQDGTVEAILQTLRAAGIDVFWLTNPIDKSAKEALQHSSSPVVLSTIQSAKGLEFPVVILSALWRSEDQRMENRKLAYVGMTRATHELAVVTTKDNPLLGDLETAILA